MVKELELEQKYIESLSEIKLGNFKSKDNIIELKT